MSNKEIKFQFVTDEASARKVASVIDNITKSVRDLMTELNRAGKCLGGIVGGGGGGTGGGRCLSGGVTAKRGGLSGPSAAVTSRTGGFAGGVTRAFADTANVLRGLSGLSVEAMRGM